MGLNTPPPHPFQKLIWCVLVHVVAHFDDEGIYITTLTVYRWTFFFIILLWWLLKKEFILIVTVMVALKKREKELLFSHTADKNEHAVVSRGRGQ